MDISRVDRYLSSLSRDQLYELVKTYEYGKTLFSQIEICKTISHKFRDRETAQFFLDNKGFGGVDLLSDLSSLDDQQEAKILERVGNLRDLDLFEYQDWYLRLLKKLMQHKPKDSYYELACKLLDRMKESRMPPYMRLSLEQKMIELMLHHYPEKRHTFDYINFFQSYGELGFWEHLFRTWPLQVNRYEEHIHELSHPPLLQALARLECSGERSSLLYKRIVRTDSVAAADLLIKSSDDKKLVKHCRKLFNKLSLADLCDFITTLQQSPEKLALYSKNILQLFIAKDQAEWHGHDKGELSSCGAAIRALSHLLEKEELLALIEDRLKAEEELSRRCHTEMLRCVMAQRSLEDRCIHLAEMILIQAKWVMAGLSVNIKEYWMGKGMDKKCVSVLLELAHKAPRLYDLRFLSQFADNKEIAEFLLERCNVDKRNQDSFHEDLESCYRGIILNLIRYADVDYETHLPRWLAVIEMNPRMANEVIDVLLYTGEVSRGLADELRIS